MAIDLPPVIPPILTDQAQVEAELARSPSAIRGTTAGTELRIYGNRYLSDEDVSTIISDAQTPSEAILTLTRRYYETGHLLVKIRYFRAPDAILVFVSQLTLATVKGDARVVAHFKSLEGDADLSIAEFDRARVLADLQAQRGGFRYDISYEEQSSQALTMVFAQNRLEDHDATDVILEINNKGSRFLGRYFGLAGIKHQTEDGTQLSAAYQTAFADLGESRDGDELNIASFSIDHPFTFGLYGIDLSKTDYVRNPRIDTSASGTVGAVCDLSSALGLGLVTQQLVGCPSDGSGRVELQADILQLNLRGEQVLRSTPWSRITLNESLKHIDSSVKPTGLTTKLLDEVYQTAEVGAKYLKTQYDSADSAASQLNLGLSLRLGRGEGGTLDDYDNYRQLYLDSHPGATSAPDVAAQARSADFIALLPTLNYQRRVGGQHILKLTARAQFANEQLPQQQQFVLGGMDGLSAYLPGVLVGDEGFFLNASIEHSYQLGDAVLTPRLFAEYGGAWYQNASSPEGDEQLIGDAGAGLKLEFGKQFYSELVIAAPVIDDVSDDDRLQALEADFYWRLKLTL